MKLSIGNVKPVNVSIIADEFVLAAALEKADDVCILRGLKGGGGTERGWIEEGYWDAKLGNPYIQCNGTQAHVCWEYGYRMVSARQFGDDNGHYGEPELGNLRELEL